jgi:hypothetical protein
MFVLLHDMFNKYKLSILIDFGDIGQKRNKPEEIL